MCFFDRFLILFENASNHCLSLYTIRHGLVLISRGVKQYSGTDYGLSRAKYIAKYSWVLVNHTTALILYFTLRITYNNLHISRF